MNIAGEGQSRVFDYERSVNVVDALILVAVLCSGMAFFVADRRREAAAEAAEEAAAIDLSPPESRAPMLMSPPQGEGNATQASEAREEIPLDVPPQGEGDASLGPGPDGSYWGIASKAGSARGWRVLKLIVTLRFLAFILFAASVGVLVIRLRRPRPPLARLLDLPGTVACAAALLVALLCVAEAEGALAVAVVAGRRSSLLQYWGCLDSTELFNSIGDGAGRAVAAVWILLYLGGKKVFRGSWIEALGTVIGLGWILLAFQRVWTALVFWVSVL